MRKHPFVWPIVVFHGCAAVSTGPHEESPLQQQLDAHRAQWEVHGALDYEYTFTNNCLCPDHIVGPTLIIVESGEVIALLQNGVHFDAEEGVRYPTIDQLFDEIQSALDRGLEGDALVVEYHAELGYPTRIYIDWEDAIADEESSYQAAGLILR